MEAGLLRCASVHARNATATTAVTRPTRRASRFARSRRSPSVLSPRKTAPWVTKRSRVVSPPSRPYGFRSVRRLPVNCLWASIGTPATMFANATPHSRAGTNEPNAIATSHRVRHRTSSRLLRYSIATPRTMSPTSSRNRAR